MARRYTRVITTPAAARRPHDGGRPLVSLLSDWGARDPSAAACHGVVLGIAPDALIVDISHDVEKYNIGHGALMLWCALPYLPVGAHVAVVDPGVGTGRRAIALETERGDYLVGPDNGLLLPAGDRLGGVTRAHLIEQQSYRLPSLSATFHGRDVFAPAAAHLAIGLPLEHIGRPLPLAELVRLDWPAALVEEGQLEATTIYVDTFGNAKLSALIGEMQAAFSRLVPGTRLNLDVAGGRRRRHEIVWANTFGDVAAGELLIYQDSYGRVCIARNKGNAAAQLGLADGIRVTIRQGGAGKPAGRGSPTTDEARPATVDQAAG